MGMLVNKTSLSLRAALVACEEAISKAYELNIKINVSVCDNAGLELAFLRMNGSYIHSIDIAKDKAYTSASFGFSSDTWINIFKNNKHLEQGFSNRHRLIPFGGGLPISIHKDILGAIGVSGGSEEEDILCAQAGIDKLNLNRKE